MNFPIYCHRMYNIQALDLNIYLYLLVSTHVKMLSLMCFFHIPIHWLKIFRICWHKVININLFMFLNIQPSFNSTSMLISFCFRFCFLLFFGSARNTDYVERGILFIPSSETYFFRICAADRK